MKPTLQGAALAVLFLSGCAHILTQDAVGSAGRGEAAPDDRPAYVMVTGSHIPQRVDPVTGRVNTTSPVSVFSAAKLADTGLTGLGQALQALEPGLELR